ncbi:GTP 3',8-cyclase MoaA [Acidobacteriota bacterium]
MISQNDGSLTDDFGRKINYLRLSVTDKCNLKCIYCHPPQDVKFLERSEICTFDELLQIVKVAARLGIEKLRVTGGEPFVRTHVISFIGDLFKIQGLKEIVLTTNGTHLSSHLDKLKVFGLRRINISLDTLSEDLYINLTGSRKFHSVLEAIDRALIEGFQIKVNMVVLNGRNDREIPSFVEYFLKKSVEVRFIEFMPLCGSGWNQSDFTSLERIKSLLSEKFDVQPLSLNSGVAREFEVTNGDGSKGKVGIIAPLSESFCSSCSRLRIAANGELRPCLFSKNHLNLLSILRSRISQEEKEIKIIEAFQTAIKIKPFCCVHEPNEQNALIRTLGG